MSWVKRERWAPDIVWESIKFWFYYDYLSYVLYYLIQKIVGSGHDIEVDDTEGLILKVMAHYVYSQNWSSLIYSAGQRDSSFNFEK